MDKTIICDYLDRAKNVRIARRGSADYSVSDKADGKPMISAHVETNFSLPVLAICAACFAVSLISIIRSALR